MTEKTLKFNNIKINKKNFHKSKQVIKEKSRNRYKNLSEEAKNKIKEYQRKRYQELIQYKKEALKIN